MRNGSVRLPSTYVHINSSRVVVTSLRATVQSALPTRVITRRRRTLRVLFVADYNPVRERALTFGGTTPFINRLNNRPFHCTPAENVAVAYKRLKNRILAPPEFIITLKLLQASASPCARSLQCSCTHTHFSNTLCGLIS